MNFLTFDEQATTNKQEPQREESKNTLRSSLLKTVIPTVLIPLAITGIVGSFNIKQETQKRIETKLENQALLIGQVAESLLEDVFKITTTVATNPLVINAARTGSQEAESLGLQRQTIEQVEERFDQSKLLRVNQILNDYLERMVEKTGLAELFFTERNGFNIASSNETSDFVQSDESWWQKGKSQGRFIDDLNFDQSADTYSIDLALAIKEPQSGEFFGVIKAVVSSSRFDRLAIYLKHLKLTGSEEVQIIDTNSGNAIDTITANGIENTRDVKGGDKVLKIARFIVEKLLPISIDPKKALEIEPAELTNELQNKNPSLESLKVNLLGETDNQILSAAFSYQSREYHIATVPNTNWVTIASIDRAEINRAGRELLGIFALTAVILGIVAIIMVDRLASSLAEPLSNLSLQAEILAKGNLDVMMEPSGTVETQTLAKTFNNLAIQIKKLLEEQKKAAQEASLLAEIGNGQIIDLESSKSIFQSALEDVRQLINADRLVIYQFNPDGSGYIGVESLGLGWKSALNKEIKDACISENLRSEYKQGRVVAIENIDHASLHPDHKKLMESLEIKANLVTPIRSQDRLFGLLIAHQCAQPRQWQKEEINFLQRVGFQLGIILDRITLIEKQQKSEREQRFAKEQLQQRALELLMEVDPISQGDLTVRASVTEDEIGTVADSYNSTVENLRKIVSQVQTTTSKVAMTTSSNEASVIALSAGAKEQREEIAITLERIKTMAQSISAVALGAEQAETAVQRAAETLQIGDAAMNRTVEDIQAIKESIAETAEKVKELGDSSQKISQVVNLISRFAAQTHLLALKASIEAARAGEKGRGFAVIADEVRILAQQSAEATEDIETLVAAIQSETEQVVAAMEAGTEQVVAGSERVEFVRENLNQIQTASREINQLVGAIAQAASEQSKDSQVVTQTMADVAAIAEKTDRSAIEVSASFGELLKVARELEDSVGQFRVN